MRRGAADVPKLHILGILAAWCDSDAVRDILTAVLRLVECPCKADVVVVSLHDGIARQARAVDGVANGWRFVDCEAIARSGGKAACPIVRADDTEVGSMRKNALGWHRRRR